VGFPSTPDQFIFFKVFFHSFNSVYNFCVTVIFSIIFHAFDIFRVFEFFILLNVFIVFIFLRYGNIFNI